MRFKFDQLVPQHSVILQHGPEAGRLSSQGIAILKQGVEPRSFGKRINWSVPVNGPSYIKFQAIVLQTPGSKTSLHPYCVSDRIVQ